MKNLLAAFLAPLFVLYTSISVQASDSLKIKSVTEKQSVWKRFQASPNRNLYLNSAGLLLTASAFTLAYTSLDQRIHNNVVKSEWPSKALPFLNLIEPMGRGKTSHFAIGTFFVAGTLAGERKLQKTAIVWAGSFILSDLIVQTGKRNFQRYRPNTGFNSRSFGDDYPNNNSLPSQHAANAFVCATVLSTMFKEKKWVAPIAYTCASFVAMQRVVKDAHWTSDVIAGAAVGFISAKTMIWVANKVEKRFFLIPSVGRNQYSLSFLLAIP